jgi:hypothetical protein
MRVLCVLSVLSTVIASPWVISKQNFHLEKNDKASFTVSLSSEPFNPVRDGFVTTAVVRIPTNFRLSVYLVVSGDSWGDSDGPRLGIRSAAGKCG